MSSWGKVHVFGPFGISDPEGRSLPLPARSSAALCALLAARWRGVSRSEIADTLWPESSVEHARAALRTALYRVRLAIGTDAIVEDDGRLRLTLESDARIAARYRRDRLRAGNAEDAIAAGAAEWQILGNELLEGWEDDWIAPLRDDGRLLASECGTALARLYEERGDAAQALAALDGVLRAVPHHLESLEGAMRLEHNLYGRERALARAAAARASLAKGEGLALPSSIRSLERAIREGVSGHLPPSRNFVDGAELALVGHMLEGSLREGGTAALAFLAEQALSPVCLRHPHPTLDLLRKALSLSEGFGPERCAVIAAAVTLASSLPENEIVHELCDMLIAHFPAEHRFHNGSLLMKGIAYLSAQRLPQAREYVGRAVEEATTEDRRLVAATILGEIDAHEGRFEAALARYLPAIRALDASDREDRRRNVASLQGHVCAARLALGDLSGAVVAGEAARIGAGVGVIYDIAAAAPHGLALVLSGRDVEGVERLRYGLVESHRARTGNAFVEAVEYAAIALHRLGKPLEAEAVLDAAEALRRSEDAPRPPGQSFLLETWGGMSLQARSRTSLRLQSPGTLAEWVGDALHSALDHRPRRS